MSVRHSCMADNTDIRELCTENYGAEFGNSPVLARLRKAGICTLDDVARTPPADLDALGTPIGLRNFLTARAVGRAGTSSGGAAVKCCAREHGAGGGTTYAWTARDGMFKFEEGRDSLWPAEEDGTVKIYYVCDDVLRANAEYYGCVRDALEEVSLSLDNDLEFIDATKVAHKRQTAQVEDITEHRSMLEGYETKLDQVRQDLKAKKKKAGLLWKAKKKSPENRELYAKRERYRRKVKHLKDNLKYSEESSLACAYGGSNQNTLFVCLKAADPDGHNTGEGSWGCEPNFYRFRGDTQERKNYVFAQGYLYLFKEELDKDIEGCERALVIMTTIVHEIGHTLGLCHTFGHPLAAKICERPEDASAYSDWFFPDQIDLGSAMMYDPDTIGLQQSVIDWLIAKGLHPDDIGLKPCLSTTDIEFLRAIYFPGIRTPPIPTATTWDGVSRPDDRWVLYAHQVGELEEQIKAADGVKILTDMEASLDRLEQKLAEYTEQLRVMESGPHEGGAHFTLTLLIESTEDDIQRCSAKLEKLRTEQNGPSPIQNVTENGTENGKKSKKTQPKKPKPFKKLVPKGLRCSRKGGVIVSSGINAVPQLVH